MESFEHELGKELAKATADVAKNTAEDIVRPTSKSVGENLGLMVDGVMGWLGYWGQKQQIKREKYLKEYKEKITQEVLAVPAEKLINPPVRIVGPAIEASKYFIEEAECRDMFAKLIGSSCNSDIVGHVHPIFPEIIKQMSPFDARFLTIFHKSNTYPIVMLSKKDSEGKITPYNHILFDFKTTSDKFTIADEMACTKSVELLERLGLIIRNDAIIELNYDYDLFKEHWLYKIVAENSAVDTSIRMHKYRLELTMIGQDFMKCCIPE